MGVTVPDPAGELTPEDIRNKMFMTVRLREGYDQADVDEFLDRVDARLTALLEERDMLRAEVSQLKSRLGGGSIA